VNDPNYIGNCRNIGSFSLLFHNQVCCTQNI